MIRDRPRFAGPPSRTASLAFAQRTAAVAVNTTKNTEALVATVVRKTSL
jgi:hypothetical protein